MKLLSDLVDNVLRSSSALSDINPGVRTELDDAAAILKSAWRMRPASDEPSAARFQKAISDVWACCAKCESPIEKLLVPWLIFQEYQLTAEYTPAVLLSADTHGAPYVLQPQASVGGSRFDFILAFRTKNGGVLLAIECDGRDFHDNVRDFYRDKSWAMAGIPTVRLTGSAIHASPQRAALKVAQALHDEAHKAGLV